MDARPTEDQQMLAELAESVAADLAPAGTEDRDDDAAGWRVLVDTGLAGLRIPEAAGGTGAGGVEVALVAEALGRHLCRVPWLGSILASELLGAGSADVSLLASVADGSRRVTLGLAADLGLEVADEVIAFDAVGAEVAVALTPTRVVLADLAGATLLDGVDLTRELRATRLEDPERLGAPDAEGRARAHALALTAVAAELVGVMDGALRAAVDHAREREQFGRPIGSFQAVQSLAAEQHVTIEGARGLAWRAGWAVDALAADDALAAARTAKAYASRAARPVVEACIQVLGGIGMTWEHPAHLHLRRALLDRAVLGDEDVQLDAIAAGRERAARDDGEPARDDEGGARGLP